MFYHLIKPAHLLYSILISPFCNRFCLSAHYHILIVPIVPCTIFSCFPFEPGSQRLTDLISILQSRTRRTNNTNPALISAGSELLMTYYNLIFRSRCNSPVHYSPMISHHIRSDFSSPYLYLFFETPQSRRNNSTLFENESLPLPYLLISL